MSELDVLFEENDNKEYQPFDKDEWIRQKQEDRDTAFAMIDDAAQNLTSVDKLNQYLDVQSRFDRYSVSNALLVTAQMPQATKLLDSGRWKKNGVFIKKGEKGIMILEPGESFKRSDGSTGVQYNVKKVFDISQTNAKRRETTKKEPDYKKLVKALVKTSPVPMKISEEIPEGMNASYNPENKVIFVRQGLEGADVFRALSVEIAFAKTDQGSFSRKDNAFQAYCVSYMVCRRSGIEPPAGKPMQPFNGKEAKEIRSELGKIRDEANSISSVIQKQLEPKSKDAR